MNSIILFIATALWAMCTVSASGGPDSLAASPAIKPTSANSGREVVVVFNTRVPESKEIASHYASARGVPADQIIGFDLSTEEEINRTEFRTRLQLPLYQALQDRKLWRVGERPPFPGTNQAPVSEKVVLESKIRYAVLCYGVPVRIQKDPTVREDAAEKMRPEMQRNEAAVDSELAFLPLLERKLPISGPLNNPVYGSTNLAALHPTNGILMVARLDGPTPQIARALVDKAMQAETNGLWGNSYFDLRNTTEEGYRTGDNWIRNASEISKHLGFETMVDTNAGTFTASYPMDHIAYYAGWYDENVSGPFAQPDVDFVPGAFAYHLHSFSAGTLRTTTRHWVGPLLNKGATITMGTVYEPYLAGTPDISTFTSRFLFHGFSFGEAACASQSVLSWMTTVVGDPLYKPFTRTPEQLHDQFMRTENPLMEWYYARLMNINLINGKPLSVCVTMLEDLGLTKTSCILSEKLAGLYWTIGKPSSSLFTYNRALSLASSPQQKLRILMERISRYTESGQDSEALADYATILKTFPDHGDKLSLYRRMLPLATKLNRREDQETYTAEIERLTGKK